MGRVLFIVFIVFWFFTAAYSSAYAESSYVLPYPSVMPGNTLYKIHTLIGRLEKYWYFGSMGQFKYNLKQSDSYLVEAKTLFEYQQYLLGDEALKNSDYYFSHIPATIADAKKDGEDVTNETIILHSAAQKHIEVLSRLTDELPGSFTWNPEKGGSTDISLQQDIQTSIKIRKDSI